ncbi:hypothetical protein C8F04DRAFT_1177725 [Mycena alexandri]|uniref:Uncharacterized protein n=1 Tax=Mycena alexandri TaxID=1745969 RepID=A0AAD6T6I7_9AGAR|nr:hypothetical protein C8F04DRAFT_1177725 [Mycena alexandri]
MNRSLPRRTLRLTGDVRDRSFEATGVSERCEVWEDVKGLRSGPRPEEARNDLQTSLCEPPHTCRQTAKTFNERRIRKGIDLNFKSLHRAKNKPGMRVVHHGCPVFVKSEANVGVTLPPQSGKLSACSIGAEGSCYTLEQRHWKSGDRGPSQRAPSKIKIEGQMMGLGVEGKGLQQRDIGFVEVRQRPQDGRWIALGVRSSERWREDTGQNALATFRSRWPPGVAPLLLLLQYWAYPNPCHSGVYYVEHTPETWRGK